MKFGIDRLLADPALRKPLEGKRVALVAHPASVTEGLVHSLDALIAGGINITSALGPQHGLKGDKQDNMVETADEMDPIYGIPVFSLYGEVRRPTAAMMDTAEVFLFDLQDLGCRIYTFVTTLLYLLEAASESNRDGGTGKAVWVLDRPNPAGRPVEGTTLLLGWESFVGAGPMPMRHGMTLGEMGAWFVEHFKLDVDYRVITMEGWEPEGPGFGWPQSRIWINPSPNAASLNMARAYAGTVMIEGATLSEGRGTTRPLEVLFGAPDVDAKAVLAEMRSFAPQWMEGCAIRECWFEPTFHKHAKTLCNALMIHAEGEFYDHHAFRPWRLQALAFKAIRRLYPDYPIWRDFPYEYVFDKLAIDVINGGTALREWVDDAASTADDLDTLARADETEWIEERTRFLLY
ncbi:exo-beta-N-acetylmuramidase NamZ domain-containing protein [Novosphingobium sp. ES2-1]|uniref:exo-beta-N-acetylmuramidase NamZ family protein n=1 Tax=Novosphingobium sp. ES2-1 TaxID=2780074 RepID=UPI001880AE70|nr:DUF1343 domain-containing protein [Novosphingobium sp. ES2-1]QOV95092.1 DUF1343 domain-containing protein [Novosphingobium sp. ES2-1]